MQLLQLLQLLQLSAYGMVFGMFRRGGPPPRAWPCRAWPPAPPSGRSWSCRRAGAWIFCWRWAAAWIWPMPWPKPFATTKLRCLGVAFWGCGFRFGHLEKDLFFPIQIEDSGRTNGRTAGLSCSYKGSYCKVPCLGNGNWN